MDTKSIEQSLERNSYLKQGRFLIGYTQGGNKGDLISIFLCHSPWTCNCIKATACECIDAGEVIVVSDDSPWSISGSWKAYSPKLTKKQ